MPLIAILLAALFFTLEELIQWQFGAMGLVAVALLSIGVKAKNTACLSIGAVVLVLLLQPTFG
ncbi:hypothetical protein [Streptomyces sp. ISL-100]|uniref:hypothetical protein n=1 Tax=Streptomyces sp. ISL-100 TaxID=2819173 RepID=UPI001BE5D933|nr:hypothetical protein [Streptomyces sp. ISL-100]MBT2401077.1 hypothetical protein [Streptomyces sp. ISL-100]